MTRGDGGGEALDWLIKTELSEAVRSELRPEITGWKHPGYEQREELF